MPADRHPRWTSSQRLVGWVLSLAALIGGMAVAAGAGTTVTTAVSHTYDAPTDARPDQRAIAAAGAGESQVGGTRNRPTPPLAEVQDTSTTPNVVVNAKNTGTDLVKYDADFAAGQLTSGRNASASQLDEFGSSQGWARSQSETGPIRYTDENGVRRLTIKAGSPRAPGSDFPHVEVRNVDGIRVDPYGKQVTRTSVGNHTPIRWDI